MKFYQKKYLKIKSFLLNHEKISAGLFFVFLICIFFAPIVFGGKTLTTSILSGGIMTNGPYKYDGNYPPFHNVKDPGAFNWQDEPLSKYIGDIIKEEHRIPLWNPNMGAGYPIIGGIQLGIFFPPNYINFLFSSQLSWDVFFLIRIFAAGFFTFLFCRRIGLDKKPSLLAGTIFMFSGYTMNYLNMAHFSSEVMIPMVLFVFENFLYKRSIKNFVFCVATIALTILPGMPEATFFTLLIAFLWFIFSLLFIHKEIHKKIKMFVALGVMGALSLLLTAIQILPFLELLRLSLHSHQGMPGLASIPLDTLPSIFYPYLFNPLHNWIACFYYFGISTLTLSFIAIFSFKKFDKYNKKIILFFSLFSFLGMAKVFGFSFINWIGALPGFNVSIFPKYAAPSIIFSISILAAYGLFILTHKLIRFINTKLIILFLPFILLTFYSLHNKLPEFFIRLEQSDGIVNQISNFFINLLGLDIPKNIQETVFSSFTFPYLIIIIFFGIFIFFIFYILIINANIRKGYFLNLIFFFVIFELYIYTLPLIRADRYETFGKPPYVNFLQQDKELFRIYGQTPQGLNAMLFPNTSSVFEIQDVRFILALTDKRYFSFLEKVLETSKEEVYQSRFTGHTQLSFDNKFFDLLNVKYFLVLPEYNEDQITQEISQKFTPILNPKNFSIIENGVWLNEKRLDGFMLHAPSKIKFPYSVEEKTKRLFFSYGIADSGVKNTNGVLLKIYITPENQPETLFYEELVNPSNNKKYQDWQRIGLDLSKYLDQEIEISFESQDNGNDAFDHFYVGNFSTLDDDIVYDNEIKIIENKDYMPRAFVVHKAREIFNQEEISNTLKSENFDIRKEIIIEKDLADEKLNGNNSPLEDNSQVKITSYEDQKVKIKANMENEGFLVLSDQYYPGWKAFVDGKEVEIYPTDYIFRSIYLEKGEHEVEFIYAPASYKIGKYISLVTLLLIIGLWFGRRKIEKLN